MKRSVPSQDDAIALAARCLDAMMACGLDVDFPFPGAPRYGSIGGHSARIAPDGSPGIPAAWLRYFDRDGSGEENAPQAPIVLALAWLSRYHFDLYRIYTTYLAEPSTRRAALAMRFSRSPNGITRALADARALLLSKLAYFSMDLTTEEYRAMLDLLRRSRATPVQGE